MGRSVLLTGVSRGLGLEIAAKMLERDGYTVYGVSRTTTSALEALAARFPSRLYTKCVDLGEPERIKAEIFSADFVGSKVKLVGFVNNAAVAYDDLITNLRLSDLEQMYRVNVFSAFMATKGVIRNMLLHSTAGSIVHLSSVSVHTGYKGLAMYASTKGALEAFSKNTAREWGSYGIRSNCVVAGFMETDMTSGLDEERRHRIYRRTALKKPTAQGSVAETVCFLLNEKAESITGTCIQVDSGTI